MELNPLDLLEASRRWFGESDELSSIAEELRGLPVSGFAPDLRASAAACAAGWGSATDAVVSRVERCAEGLRHTAELGIAVDAEAASAFRRLGAGLDQ